MTTFLALALFIGLMGLMALFIRFAEWVLSRREINS